PEYMFQDNQGIPTEYIGESWLSEDVFRYFEILEKVEDADKLTLHNEYCENTSRHDDMIYCFDEDFFNTYFDGRPMEAARAMAFGNVNWSDEYITFDGYGNLESINDIDDYIDLDEIIEDILEN